MKKQANMLNHSLQNLVKNQKNQNLIKHQNVNNRQNKQLIRISVSLEFLLVYKILKHIVKEYY